MNPNQRGVSQPAAWTRRAQIGLTTDRADGKVSAGTPSPQPTPTPSLGGAGQSMGHGILLAT